MTVLSSTNPPAPAINYPVVPRSRALLGFNIGIADDARVALGMAAGATIFRCQFGWDVVQDYTTGNFDFSAGDVWLSSLATRGGKALIVSAFGPPRATIGTLTVNTLVPAGSPAGTSIPVNSYGFTIDTTTDFAGGLFFGGGLTSRSAYYGDVITTATSSSIQIAAALSFDLNPGDTISIQRLRYAPPTSDNHPSNTAYVNYVLALAQHVHSKGVEGWLDIWNEFEWAHDRWPHPQSFYDSAPGSITTSNRMLAILTALQSVTLPDGIKLVNGVSDKSGSSSIANQGISGTNFTHDSLHTYHNNPEGWCISPFGWGATIGQFPGSTAHWDAAHQGSGWDGWDSVIPSDQSGNFRGAAFSNQFKPGGPFAPDIMTTETGLVTANDQAQARWVSRRVLAEWGNGYPASIIFQLDSGATPGGALYDVAPSLTPRPAYTALQRITGVIGRMDSGSATTAQPTVVGWPSTANPLMSTTVAGNSPGNYVLFAWQRTWRNDNTDWTTVDSPTSGPVSVFLPAGLAVAEALDVISGATVTVTTVSSKLITVPVTDEPVAIRFAPA